MKLKILESNLELSPKELSIIQDAIISVTRSQKSSNGPLTGRLPWKKIKIKNTSIHLKVSVLGGTLGKLASFLKLSLAATRVRKEFFWLHVLDLVGLNVPKPFAYMILNLGLKKMGILLTHFIDGKTMSTVFQENRSLISKYISILETEFIKLLNLPVIHLDFHPGNILVGKDDKVYLLDLASLRVMKKPKLELLDYYFKRWRRACLKHKLPDEAIHYFAEMVARLKNEQSLY